jgi:hypothetical protein
MIPSQHQVMIILVCPRILRDPIQLPEQTTTSDWGDTKNDFVSVLILQTISDCSVVADGGEVCVIWFILMNLQMDSIRYILWPG